MPARRTLVNLPEDLLCELDRLIGKRARSEFLGQSAATELKRRRQSTALQTAFGAWQENAHPELADGAMAYQKRLRAESDHRPGRGTRRD